MPARRPEMSARRSELSARRPELSTRRLSCLGHQFCMLRASATSVGRGLASTRNLVTQDVSRGAEDAGERAGTSEAERRERLTRLMRRRSKLSPTKLEEPGNGPTSQRKTFRGVGGNSPTGPRKILLLRRGEWSDRSTQGFAIAITRPSGARLRLAGL